METVVVSTEENSWETEGGGAYIDPRGCIQIVTFLGEQITIHPDEWEEMRHAVDQAVAAVRKLEKERGYE